MFEYLSEYFDSVHLKINKAFVRAILYTLANKLVKTAIILKNECKLLQRVFTVYMMRVYKLARTIQVHLVRRRSNSLMFKETDKNGLVLFVTFSLNRSHRMAAVTVAT